MQEVFEKIIEKLEGQIMIEENIAKKESDGHPITHQYAANCMKVIEKSVKQEAEKFGTDTNVGSNGWIPVEEELPKTDEYILLSFSNFSIPCVGRYEEDENGGAFYVGDDDETCLSQDMFVNAWMNLPTPYQPKGE